MMLIFKSEFGFMSFFPSVFDPFSRYLIKFRQGGDTTFKEVPRRLLESSWAPSWGQPGGQKTTRSSLEASLEAFWSVLDASWWDFSDFHAKKGIGIVVSLGKL